MELHRTIPSGNPHRPAIIAKLGLASVLALASLAGCALKGGGSGAQREAADTLAVQLVRAETRQRVALVLPARVAAREEVTVTARVAGRLTALPASEGDSFAAGQALAMFEAPEMREALASARAGLDAATVRRDNARRQEARMDSLFAARVVALRDLDQARGERRDADAADAAAGAALDQIDAGVRIAAPFAGVVVRRRVDPGTSVLPGQPLLEIRSNAVGEILASVPESALESLRADRASFQIGDGPWHAARLTWVDGMTDFATRTRIARFAPAPSAVALEPGAFARIRLIAAPSAAAAAGDATARPADDSVPSVPTRALVRRGALAGVYVVREGRARLRWIKPGRADDASVAVLGGLDPGEAVVADPTGLWDGRPVRVRP